MSPFDTTFLENVHLELPSKLQEENQVKLICKIFPFLSFFLIFPVCSLFIETNLARNFGGSSFLADKAEICRDLAATIPFSSNPKNLMKWFTPWPNVVKDTRLCSGVKTACLISFEFTELHSTFTVLIRSEFNQNFEAYQSNLLRKPNLLWKWWSTRERHVRATFREQNTSDKWHFVFSRLFE